MIDCSSDFDFAGPNYKTKYFELKQCGDCVGEGWSEDHTKLERIIKAISKTNMRLSLKLMNVWECGLDKVTVENLLDKYVLTQVQVELTE